MCTADIFTCDCSFVLVHFLNKQIWFVSYFVGSEISSLNKNNVFL